MRSADSEDKGGVPGTAVQIVRLDAVVADSHGELVKGLTSDDFVVLEDGKRQRINQFVVAHTATAPPAVENPMSKSGGKEAAAPGFERQVAIVVDDLHIARGNVSFARDALRHFVESMLEPGDNVGLVTTSGSSEHVVLGRDRAGLAQAIAHLNTHDARSPQVLASDFTAEQAEQILRGDINAVKLAADTSMREVGNKFSDPAIAAAGSNIASPGVDPNEASAAEDARRRARAILAQALHYSVSTLETLEGVLRGLANLPGRKLCLLVSDGFLVGQGTEEERTRNLQAVVDAATRSGSVVYALDARGLVTSLQDASVGFGPGVSPNLQHSVDRLAERQLESTLERVSRDTGGFLVHGTNDLESGLRRMLVDNETYYLMAYEPSNLKQDGRFRKIEVRIRSHPEYVVRTRAGYVAPGAKAIARAELTSRPTASVRPTTQLDIESMRGVLAMQTPADGSQIPVEMMVDYLQQPPNGPEAVIHGHVDVKGLKWDDAAGRRHVVFDFGGAVYDEDGVLVGDPFGQHKDLSLEPVDFKRLLGDGFEFEQQLGLHPGRYQVKIVAHDPRGGSVGGAAKWLEIPDLGSKKLALSGLFLLAATGTSAGAEIFRDAQALRHFRSGETLYFQVYVFNPLKDAAGDSDVVLQAQIWNVEGVLAASKPQKSVFRSEKGKLSPETQGMSLADLPPGHYDLKVVVVDNKAQATAQRTVDFTVE